MLLIIFYTLVDINENYLIKISALSSMLKSHFYSQIKDN